MIVYFSWFFLILFQCFDFVLLMLFFWFNLLQTLFPGSWLAEVSAESYKVADVPEWGKFWWYFFFSLSV